MQRLYSIFPLGRPGIALLLLRIGLSVILVEAVSGQPMLSGSAWAIAALGIAGLLLLMGLLTPFVCALCVALAIAQVLFGGNAVGPIQACLVLDAVALTLLGPGGYSMDARLYGRQQIVLPTDAAAGHRDDSA